MSVLTGACNRCGRCCEATGNDGRPLRCAHLSGTRTIGQPWATFCSAYSARYDGMPIDLVDPATGAVVRQGRCWKDSAMEEIAILLKGVGRGCSLQPVAAVTLGGIRG